MSSTLPRVVVCAGFVIAFSVLATQAAAQGAAPDDRNVLNEDFLYARILEIPVSTLAERKMPRPVALPVFYASFVGLELYDGYSTSRGLALGAAESNPFVRWAVEHPLSLWAMKGAAAAGSIYMAERLWRHGHRRQAIAVMIVSNAFMGFVAARNTIAISAVR
jgi:hypothetical protein